jgi:alpha-tubulin suppressor-like RCC1 family protein
MTGVVTSCNLKFARAGARCTKVGDAAQDGRYVLKCNARHRWERGMTVAAADAAVAAWLRSQVPTTTQAPTSTTPPTTPPPTTTTVPDVPEPPAARDIVAGADHTCGFSVTQVICWGRNDHGQLGDGTTTNRSDPVTVALPFTHPGPALAAGDEFTCAAGITDQAMEVWCWGANDAGQLGDGTTTERHAPGLALKIDDDFTLPQISAGARHICVAANQLFCWGANDRGQLGIGTFSPHVATPTAIDLPTDVGGRGSLSAGGDHTCALVPTGPQVWCWGANDRGQVGDGTTVDRSSPAEVLAVSSVVALGDDFSCAMDYLEVRCWGDNSHGQLGLGTFSPDHVLTPTAWTNPGVNGFVPIPWAGGEFLCVYQVGAGGRVDCLGRNDEGQLGQDDLVDASTLRTVTFEDGTPLYSTDTYYLPMALGRAHACAMWDPTYEYQFPVCWGDDTYGQLGPYGG